MPYKDLEKRRVYQRELMRKRRAENESGQPREVKPAVPLPGQLSLFELYVGKEKIFRD
jgi:hypothetical protein